MHASRAFLSSSVWEIPATGLLTTQIIVTKYHRNPNVHWFVRITAYAAPNQNWSSTYIQNVWIFLNHTNRRVYLRDLQLFSRAYFAHIEVKNTAISRGKKQIYKQEYFIMALMYRDELEGVWRPDIFYLLKDYLWNYSNEARECPQFFTNYVTKCFLK